MRKLLTFLLGDAPSTAQAIVTDEHGYPVIITVKLEGAADE